MDSKKYSYPFYATAAIILLCARGELASAEYDSVVAFRGVRSAISGFSIYRSKQYFEGGERPASVNKSKVAEIKQGSPLSFCFSGAYDVGKSMLASKVTGTDLLSALNASTVGISVVMREGVIAYDFAGEGVVNGDALQSRAIKSADNILTDTAAGTKCAVVFVYPFLNDKTRRDMDSKINRIVATRSRKYPEYLSFPFFAVFNSQNADSGSQLQDVVAADAPLIKVSDVEAPWNHSSHTLSSAATSGSLTEGEVQLVRDSHREYTYPLHSFAHKVTLKTFVLGKIGSPIGNALLEEMISTLTSRIQQKSVPVHRNPSLNVTEDSLVSALETAIGLNLPQVSISLSRKPATPEKLDMCKGGSAERGLVESMTDAIGGFFTYFKPITNPKPTLVDLFSADTLYLEGTSVDEVGKAENAFGDISYKLWTEEVALTGTGRHGISGTMSHLQLNVAGCGEAESSIKTVLHGDGFPVAHFQCKGEAYYPMHNATGNATDLTPSENVGNGWFSITSPFVCPALTSFSNGRVDIVALDARLFTEMKDMCTVPTACSGVTATNMPSTDGSLITLYEFKGKLSLPNIVCSHLQESVKRINFAGACSFLIGLAQSVVLHTISIIVGVALVVGWLISKQPAKPSRVEMAEPVRAEDPPVEPAAGLAVDPEEEAQPDNVPETNPQPVDNL